MEIFLMKEGFVTIGKQRVILVQIGMGGENASRILSIIHYRIYG